MKKDFKNKYLRILKYVNKYKKQGYTSIFIAILLSFLAPVRPWLIQKTLQDYIQKSPLVTAPDIKTELINAVIWISLIQIGFLLIETFLRFLFSYISAYLGQLIVKDLRLEVFNKIIHLKLSQFDKTPIGTLSTRTVNDIESINNVFSEGFIPILADILSIVIVLITMFYVDVKMSLITLTAFPILLIATYFFKQSVKKSFQKVRVVIAQLNSFVQERLSGIQFIQVNNLQTTEFDKFKKINYQHKKANTRAILAYSIFFPVVEIISTISLSFLIYSAISIKVDASLILFYFLCLNQIFKPLRFIADKFNVVQMGMVASERIFDVLDNTEVLQNQDEPHTHKINKKINGNIEFKNVIFSYETSPTPVLKSISFKINQGEKVAFVGPTGSGKSSIISLLNRLYQHQSGDILIDNIRVENYELNNLRSQIGVILQDVFLFAGSVRDNLTFNNPNISNSQIIEAATHLGVHDIIMQLPNQYEFNVMENGTLLSAGQRQLLSFTRTLIYNPKILIMDEATSSIDKTSELIIEKAMAKLMQNRTCIIIAHRLSTIQKVDKILFVKNGEIKEVGTHQQLLNKQGLYFNLFHQNIE